MKIETQEDIDILQRNLEIISDKVQNIHKLVSLLNKYCKANKEKDDLYEVSYIAELVENKINEVGYDLYITQNNENPKSIEEILENIKAAVEKKQIIFND